MEEKNETKKEENEEEMSSMAPHVNEKVKYCLIALIIVLIVDKDTRRMLNFKKIKG